MYVTQPHVATLSARMAAAAARIVSEAGGHFARTRRESRGVSLLAPLSVGHHTAAQSNPSGYVSAERRGGEESPRRARRWEERVRISDSRRAIASFPARD